MTTPDFDVQSALAAMGDYPAMLKRLGVIRILEVDLAGSGIDPAAGAVTVSAKPSWTGGLPSTQRHVTPVTVPAHLSPSRFALTADGRLDLAAAGITVSEVDTDSAASRLVDLARQVVNAEEDNSGDGGVDGASRRLPPVDLPQQLALPPLRNAGLALAQTDRAVDLRDRLEAGRALHYTFGTKVLSDPKLAVLGHVLDVWDDRTRRWHTVCARRGTYRLPDRQPFTLDDEGPISLAATSREGGNAFSAMYLHQSLVRWTGWSLVAPRPGEPVTTESPGSEPQPGDPALPGFSVDFEAVPGTLPRLRFGAGYRFQLRTVDLAGHADPLSPGSTDFSRATDLVRYLRFEPIVAPIVVAAAPMTEGESVETLVIRPRPWGDGPVGSLLAPLLATQPARHLAPPKVGQLLCEEHGRLDRPDGTPDPAKYQLISERDAANLSNVGTPDPRQPGQRYVSSSTLSVTWLPDPLCKGAAISGLPTGLLKIRFDPSAFKSWPDMRAFRLQVADGELKPAWNGLFRLLTIYVPRGETYPVRLSSFMDAPDLAVLGPLGWLAESGAKSEEVSAAQNDVLGGQAWQITPYRSLQLVNAVRIPVKAPKLEAITPGIRHAGSTRQELEGTATVHRPSTGTLTLAAKWTDPVDDPAQDAPAERTARTTPLVLPLTYEGENTVEFAASHDLGDTKRHKVEYSLVGTTRYLEHFVQRGEVVLEGTEPEQVATSGIAPGTDAVRSADGKTTYRRDVDYVVDEGAGTIARTESGAIPSGASVEVAIVAQPVSRPSSGKPLVLDLPSTARPLPPKVAWIVPTFGWKETSADFGLSRTRSRSGGGLRIFLERGWYSSGLGEQLAVVLGNGGAPTDPQLLALLTQVGADPTVVTPAPGRFPTPDDFSLAVARRGNLTPAELDSVRVAIAAHDVTYDTQRQRWACDIVLPPGMSYQPFASLALARYQPNSLDGVELSPLAAVEWAQLSPDRSATVGMDLLDPTRLKVTVVGRAPAATEAAPGQTNAVSVIVQAATSFSPSDLEWQVIGPAEGYPLTASTQPGGVTVWSTSLKLPASRLLRPHRLVVTEWERNTGGGRLVYSDVIRL